VPGGTGPDAVKIQIEEAEAAAQPARETPRGNQLKVI
jgi:hypothetical protein